MSKKINFSIFEKDNSTFVEMVQESPLGSSEKTIQLDDFLKFVTDFNADKISSDSGFVVPNLVRKVNKGTKELCIYHFPELLVSPYCNTHTNFTSLPSIVNPPSDATLPFKLTVERAIYTRHGDERNYTKLQLHNLKMKNVILITFYDKATRTIISYNVFHSLNRDSIFEDTLSPTVSDSTLLFHSIMPNHYPDKICWGSTGFEGTLREYFREDNYDGIKTVPLAYFNSLFNDDLSSSNYGSPKQYIISESLLNGVAKYYEDNFPSSNDTHLASRVKEVLISNLSYDQNRDSNTRETTYSLNSSPNSLLLIMGPIFSDPVLYKKYFEELFARANTEDYRKIHTISSYIQSRLA